jgi:hypothetical protein
VICGEVLSNESLKQNKLKRRLEAKHSTFVGKDSVSLKEKNNKSNDNDWILQPIWLYILCNKSFWLGRLQSRSHTPSARN